MTTVWVTLGALLWAVLALLALGDRWHRGRWNQRRYQLPSALYDEQLGRPPTPPAADEPDRLGVESDAALALELADGRE